jgi:hypothetical protein
MTSMTGMLHILPIFSLLFDIGIQQAVFQGLEEHLAQGANLN